MISKMSKNNQQSSLKTLEITFKMNNDRADGYCYSWLDLTILDVRWPLLFSPETDFICNYLHIVQKWTKHQCGKLKKKFKISVHGTSNPAISQLQGTWNYGF